MKLLITVQGIQYEVDVEVLDDSTSPPAPAPAESTHLAGPATPAPAGPRPSRSATFTPPAGGVADAVTSPLAGNVFKVEVRAGQKVKANEVLLILEAMKMETPIKSPRDGTVKSVAVHAGDSVSPGQLLVAFE